MGVVSGSGQWEWPVGVVSESGQWEWLVKDAEHRLAGGWTLTDRQAN